MNLEILSYATPAIIIHTVTAFTALGLGTAMWLRKKGTRSHKMLGRIFVVFMAVTALSSLFIRGINNGSFSWIHLFVPLSLFAIWEIFHHVRRGNVHKHQRAAQGLFFGALLIPGILSFMPGRMMWHLVFG